MRVLGVGIATLDVVQVVDRYPTEDAEVRALGQHRRRGGNATNTLVALAQLGHEVSWAGTVADDAESREVLGLARGEGIDARHAVACPGGRTPMSCVTSSLATGSRTIVHHRDLREYGAQDFARVPLTGLDWVHFEGRNVAELGPMLRRCRDEGVPCSLEVEKPRDGIEALFDLPDLVLFSRQYARHRGFADGASLLQSLPERAGQALYCAWGDAGAWAIGADRVPAHSPAFPPARLVDTVGAGDVFNAGVIDGQLRGLTVPAILRHARCAGWSTSRTPARGASSSPDRVAGPWRSFWCARAGRCAPTATAVRTPGLRWSGDPTSSWTSRGASSSARCMAPCSRRRTAGASGDPAPATPSPRSG